MNSVALMIFGDINSNRNALTEEKYKDLAAAFAAHGFNVESVLYNDGSVGRLTVDLLKFAAVLVWVNPIEQGTNRKKLDSLLAEISGKGCFVSTHPEVILKMGTKDVLYKTKDMDWGGDTKMYTSYEDFLSQFYDSLKTSGIRVLKQYRGNGGNGVYKVAYVSPEVVKLTHAIAGNEDRILDLGDFYNEFKPFFLNHGLLIDQEWNENITNGMVRCYLTGKKVSGFGFQEINALYKINDKTFLPGKRYYFTQNCGLFSDLKEIIETKWVAQLQNTLSIADNMMPVIWDADFFINVTNTRSTEKKYTLCEINVSCVSPFPPSAIEFIVDEVKNRIKQ